MKPEEAVTQQMNARAAELVCVPRIVLEGIVASLYRERDGVGIESARRQAEVHVDQLVKAYRTENHR